MNKMSTARRAAIINLLVEGMSMRSITRAAGCSFNAVNKLLIDAGEACADFHNREVVDLAAGHVQVDELWAFCYAKQRRINEGSLAPPPAFVDHAGHTWTWTALDVDSKFMVSWLTAPRDNSGAFALMEDLKARVKSIVQLSTDGLYSYVSAVDMVFGKGIDYGVLVKPNTTDDPELVGPPIPRPKPTQKVVSGNPDHINTSFVERANLTLRMGNRRFTRLTNAFSKKLKNHKNALALFYVHYNWCRVHKTLKTTPAVAAGLAKERYPVSWIIDLIDSRAPKPNRPKHYKRRVR